VNSAEIGEFSGKYPEKCVENGPQIEVLCYKNGVFKNCQHSPQNCQKKIASKRHISHKNTIFLCKNTNFPIKNTDFPIKNTIKTPKNTPKSPPKKKPAL
jgi:hypothetical protein